MKNYTKFIAIFLVLAVFLSVPALAASSGWNSFKITDDMWDFEAVYYDTDSGEAYWIEATEHPQDGRPYWTLPALSSESGTLTFSIKANTSFNVSAGDIAVVDSHVIQWFIGGSTNFVKRYRIAMGFSPLNPTVYSPWYNTGYTIGHATQNVIVKQQQFHFTEPGTIAYYFVQFDISHPSKGTFELYYPSVTISYGNPNSPEAPGYTPPDNSGVDNYDDIESGLLGSVEGSKDTVSGIFTGFSVDPFLPGLAGWIALFNLVLPRLDWLHTLLTTSLALGLFAFLFNVVAIIVKRRGNSA